MILDKELCFLDQAELQNVGNGVLGDPIDLGGPGQFKGRQCYIVILCHSDTTATGDPTMTFSLEFSDTEDFAAKVEVPLSLPPQTKENLSEGNFIGCRAPNFSKRYCRLKLETDITLACTSMTAGITLDMPEGLFGNLNEMQ